VRLSNAPRGATGHFIVTRSQREPQTILKTDDRNIILELGLQGKFAAKSTGWDENRIFLEGNKLEVAVKDEPGAASAVSVPSRQALEAPSEALIASGRAAYLEAVEGAFGADVDYAQLVKLFGAAPESMKGRYSPAECIGARKERIEGNPDPKHVSTSFAERQNLTMRMQMRRFTRLTNAFSKKFENHMHMVSLYTVWYNYVKQHKSLKGLSPAMAAGLSDTLWSMTDLAEMVNAAAPKPGKRGPYRKIIAT
jgi:hypothetical protein